MRPPPAVLNEGQGGHSVLAVVAVTGRPAGGTMPPGLHGPPAGLWFHDRKLLRTRVRASPSAPATESLVLLRSAFKVPSRYRCDNETVLAQIKLHFNPCTQPATSPYREARPVLHTGQEGEHLPSCALRGFWQHEPEGSLKRVIENSSETAEQLHSERGLAFHGGF